jgi:hypothetical protein
MVYHGHIENGVVVLEDADGLPEGAKVTVKLDDSIAVPGDTQTGRDWKGIYRGMGPVPTEEDIREMRREAWPEQ